MCSTCHDNKDRSPPCPDCHGHPYVSCERAGCTLDDAANKLANATLPKVRPCWLYLVEYVHAPNYAKIVGVRIIEHRSETTAKPDNKESRMLGAWRTDDRVTDDERLREWSDECYGFCKLARLGFEIERSRRAAPV